MSMPGFTVEPVAVEGLAGELDALATELGEDAAAARSTAASLLPALDGEVGWFAADTARAWAAVEEVLASRTGVVAQTFRTAVAAYRADDVSLTQYLGAAVRRETQGPR